MVPTEDDSVPLTDLRQRLAALANELLGHEDAELLCELARPAVRLTAGNRDTGSHLGGSARLEPSQDWPALDGRSLALIVVLDLADLARFATDIDLPEGGYLSFFYDAEEQSAWGFEPDDRTAWRVLFAESLSAVDVAPPDDAPAFPAVGLVAEQALTIPGWEEPAVASIFPAHAPPRRGLFGLKRDKRDRERREAYLEIEESWRPTLEASDRVGHQVGGWPALQQGPIWRECDLVSQGYPLGTADQVRAGHQAGVPDTQADWRLLLQVESDDDAGWMWGDLGALYYAVRSSGSTADGFDQAWMVLQCG